MVSYWGIRGGGLQFFNPITGEHLLQLNSYTYTKIMIKPILILKIDIKYIFYDKFIDKKIFIFFKKMY